MYKGSSEETVGRGWALCRGMQCDSVYRKPGGKVKSKDWGSLGKRATSEEQSLHSNTTFLVFGYIHSLWTSGAAQSQQWWYTQWMWQDPLPRHTRTVQVTQELGSPCLWAPKVTFPFCFQTLWPGGVQALVQGMLTALSMQNVWGEAPWAVPTPSRGPWHMLTQHGDDLGTSLLVPLFWSWKESLRPAKMTFFFFFYETSGV